ncbi:SPOR domain-containing protein [uncultured Sphingomonas sp.]|uniref:SPOR domain-containing protein n=1 Tax=uncultured Sphingomonas sp. TaxID=158754 RepID=UPI001F96E00D|nr:SPOR domain-containing protein [uncultured Sphingomonas sp.]HIV76658.1 SPOR domain-containing protein [Candidatus Sphingomonas excrementigallinarum]
MANETDGRALDLDEADRLPWLETVEADEPEGVGIGKVVALVILGLAILAAIGFGFYKWQANRAAADGDGAVIAAPEGDYKVRPADPGGLKVKGEGNTAIATSAGKPGGTGAIDLRAVPEAPMNGTRVVQKPAEPNGGRNAVAQVPESGGKLVAPAPVAAARAPAAAPAGGAMVQLGAYPSESSANAAWDRFSKRFSYVAALGKVVQPVASNGKTLYRLRVNAGSANQAADICGRLRVAGESCFVAS